MAPADRTDLQRYWKYLYSQKEPFPCPHCHESVSARFYETHSSYHHNLNSLICCVWCFGAKTWPTRYKYLNGRHLKMCAQRFQNLIRRIPLNSFDMTLMGSAKNLFYRFPDTQPRAYEPIWPVPLPPNLLLFATDSLNWAVSCIQLYLGLRHSTYWAHIYVHSLAYSSFLQAIDSDEGRTRTLPFFCWCNGGLCEEVVDNCKHRHMIVVSPSETHFHQNVWSKLSIPEEERPFQKYRSFHNEPILCARHLVNTLNYVSQSIISDNSEKHFYIFQSLPKDFKWVLFLQWEGGLAEWLDEECRNIGWKELVRAPFTRARGQWQIHVQDIPGIRLGPVPPVSRDFLSCDQPTDYALHLLDGEKLYFERSPFMDPLPQNLWLKEEVSRDNRLYDEVRKAAFTLCPFQQKLINTFKPDVDRNWFLELENKRFRREDARLRQENECLSQEIERLRQESTTFVDSSDTNESFAFI